MSIEKSRKQDAEANVRKGMTLITCTLQVKKKNPQRRKINSKSRKQDAEANVRKRMTLITCTL